MSGFGWVVVGLVALGVLLVAGAVGALPARLRPLRRALRVLGWRQQDAQRVLARAEVLRDELAGLQERVAALSAPQAAQGDEPRSAGSGNHA